MEKELVLAKTIESNNDCLNFKVYCRCLRYDALQLQHLSKTMHTAPRSKVVSTEWPMIAAAKQSVLAQPARKLRSACGTPISGLGLC